jgi:two-component system, NarL family, sensor histidine kinase DegS
VGRPNEPEPGASEAAATAGEPAPQDGPVAVALHDAEEQLDRLGRELAEIGMLEQQTRGEAARHEQRRSQAADRLTAVQGRADADPDELREAITQLVTLTRRSAMMESQVDVLVGKQKALMRYRDHLVTLVEVLRAAGELIPADTGGQTTAEDALPATASRAILSAQEDMRRDIARAMHDGPAQSLANIVLQAQIVERLVRDDQEAAVREAGSFIFNVRPMVLDDLGLVPTLRRLARDRGREAAVPIEFDSVGADRRLDLDLETGLFRIIDEAIVSYAAREPSRIELTLTWEPKSLSARVQAAYLAETVLALPPDAPLPAEPAPRKRGGRAQGEDLLPALAAMIQEQRADDEARSAPPPPRDQGLPAATWRDIEQRARSLAIDAHAGDDGRSLELALALAS